MKNKPDLSDSVTARVVVISMKRHMSQKVYNINLNKTCAVYIQQAHCSLVVYNYDHKLRYFINYMVVYKVTW